VDRGDHGGMEFGGKMGACSSVGLRVQRRQYRSADAKDRSTGVMLFQYQTVAAYNWIEVTALKRVITLFFFN